MDRLAAKRMQQALGKVDEVFKRLHFAIVDLPERRKDLETEHAIFDEHEDRIGNLGDHLQQLVLWDKSATAPPMGLEAAAEPSWLSRRRLQRLRCRLISYSVCPRNPILPGIYMALCYRIVSKKSSS